MKRLIIITMLLVIAASCSKEGAILPTSESNNDVIPKEEALELVINHSKLLYPETRSNLNLSISDAITLTKKDLSKATRSVVSSEIPDTALYIFNFANNSGYAVTSANRKYGNTLFCITESGSLSVEDFGPIQTRASGDTSGINDGTHFITDLITASIMSNEIAPPIDSTEVGGGPGLIIDEKYGPLVLTKWQQDVSPFTDSTVVGCPIGCMTVAVGQVIVANRIANSMIFNGKTCSWDDLESVCFYSNRTYTGSSEAKLQVANFIKVITDENHCDINFSPNGSSGTMEGAQRTLLSLGYSSVTINRHLLIDYFTDNDAYTVTNHIKSGKPVIMSGSNGFVGHAWVIDGYIHYTVNSEFYHINWGYNGLSDGYFWVGSFAMYSRFMRDSIDPSWQYGALENYDSELQYITYNY